MLTFDSMFEPADEHEGTWEGIDFEALAQDAAAGTV